MTDVKAYLKRLELSNILREPILRSSVDSLQLPPGSKGLDAGCGTGFNTLMLAKAVGASGHVIGLDILEEFLTKGRSLAAKADLMERASFKKGDVKDLPFEDNCFDWACSIDLVGLVPIDPVFLLKELARVVKPGGRIFILIWSSQMLLPGYPLLEARLNATSFGLAPYDTKKRPELHSMRALEWFQQAGLSEPMARTFVRDINHPLNSEMLEALADLFKMRWGEDNGELSKEERVEYLRLCRDDSTDFILNIPGYYAFFTYSLFCGKVV